jgi:hypothetical protein
VFYRLYEVVLVPSSTDVQLCALAGRVDTDANSKEGVLISALHTVHGSSLVVVKKVHKVILIDKLSVRIFLYQPTVDNASFLSNNC